MGGLAGYSVLMSAYAKDRPEWILASLESMALQSLPPEQVVLVLDGPVKDDLLDAVMDFDRKHPGMLCLVPLKKNGGLGPALNAGLPLCSGEVIVRMDADDISRPERCERELRVIADGYDMVGCNVVEFSSVPAHPNATRVLPEKHEEILRFAKKRAPFAHPAFAVKRSALEKVGGYRDVRYAEDFDLFIRLLSSGCRGYNIQEPLVAMRVDSEAYRRRGGISYLRDMLAFNLLQLKEGWFGPIDFVVRSAANMMVALVPNAARDAIYKRLLRKGGNESVERWSSCAKLK